MASKIEKNALFNSFDEFREALSMYEKETFSKFTILYSKSVQRRNEQIVRSKKGEKMLLDEKLKYANVQFVCKHGTTYVSKGRGIRPNQGTNKFGCPVKIVLNVTRDGSHLQIMEFIDCHNHKVSKDIYNRYSEGRGLKKAEKKSANALQAENIEANEVNSCCNSYYLQVCDISLTAAKLHHSTHSYIYVLLAL